jgi:hypothetical protein
MAIQTHPLLLPILLTLLAIDSLLEVGFIGSMVSYLHQSHKDIPFLIAAIPPSTPEFGLYPKPAHVSVNQGHTSNGAAGTALILVSILGFLVLWLEKRGRRITGQRRSGEYTHVRTTSDGAGNTHTRKERHLPRDFAWLYPTWVVFTVLSFLLTLSALIYTFVITHQTSSSRIDVSLAISTYENRNGAVVFPYPGDTWTPETWFKQVLKLGFVEEGEKGDIRTHVRLMEGWRFNLIPLFLLGGAVMGLAVVGWVGRRTGRGEGRRGLVREKHVSTVEEM